MNVEPCSAVVVLSEAVVVAGLVEVVTARVRARRRGALVATDALMIAMIVASTRFVAMLAAFVTACVAMRVAAIVRPLFMAVIARVVLVALAVLVVLVVLRIRECAGRQADREQGGEKLRFHGCPLFERSKPDWLATHKQTPTTALR
jgi:hypothetical protein